MAIFFTADTHFGGERTRYLSMRPFSNTKEMDSFMIKQWNEVVSENDTVYHLGDFGKYSCRTLLNGKIHLLLGNYERKDIEDNLITPESLKQKYNFDEVYHNNKVSINVYGIKMDIVHEPSNRIKDNFTLFGHIHRLQMVKRNALNVGVDCHFFKPLSFEEVMQWKTGIQKFHDDEVFMQ